MIQAAGQATAQDMPRLSRLKASLAGFLLSGVPGAVTGAIDPEMIQRQAAAKRQMQQAEVIFASAHAAHEVAMAHQADLEYQALPEKLQQEAESRAQTTMTAARQNGYMPVATIPLDQGSDQNSQNAMTALNQVKSQFGAVPSGLLYVHTGNAMTVMKLQDPTAALDTVNQARRAQGMSPIEASVFQSLKPEDRDNMARDAINFSDPRDINGMVTQSSLNLANMRLQTVKSQPDFNGKDKLVTQLQGTVDHQKAVLDSGAGQEAIRAGQAKGTEAQAAQPGQTAAKVSEINATAGPEAQAAATKEKALANTPQGRAALAETSAKIKNLNAETDKALSEVGLGGLKPADPVIGYDSGGNSIMTNAKDAQGLGLHDTMKPDAAMVEKVTIARSYIALNNQLQADIDQLDKAGKLGVIASRWNEFMTGDVGKGEPEFEKFRVDLGLANTALMQFHVGNRGGSQMLEHFENLANGKKMDANTLKAGISAEGDYAAHRAMMPAALAKQIGTETLRKTQPPVPPPAGATMKVPGSDGKLHWSDGKKDLGVIQ